MNAQLVHLVEAVWEHDLPLGPWGDLEYRERAEREWEQSLTSDDCLTLLEWVADPVCPPQWDPYRERWLPGLADSAARHAGRAGKRLNDKRVLRRLIDLLSKPSCRYSALEGLIEFDDPMAFDDLLKCLGDTSNRCSVCVAIAGAASSEQVERLREMGRRPDLAPALRDEIAEIVAECDALKLERGISSQKSFDRDHNIQQL
jgi:hypothetical protein